MTTTTQQTETWPVTTGPVDGQPADYTGVWITPVDEYEQPAGQGARRVYRGRTVAGTYDGAPTGSVRHVEGREIPPDVIRSVQQEITLYSVRGESYHMPDRIRAARKAAGLSQAALSRATGFSQPEISDYERGERTPSTDRVPALCRALGVTSDWLLGLSEEGGPDLQAPDRPAEE